MNVLSCNRTGCENIMCDRYSSVYGYICNDCFNELLAQSNNDITDYEIEQFMQSEKTKRDSSDKNRRYNTLDEIFEYN